jgi:hypothetical protein
MVTKTRTADFWQFFENTGSAVSKTASDRPVNFKSLYHENAELVFITALTDARGKSKSEEKKVWHVPLEVYKTTCDVDCSAVASRAVELTMVAYDDVIMMSCRHQCMGEGRRATRPRRKVKTRRKDGLERA